MDFDKGKVGRGKEDSWKEEEARDKKGGKSEGVASQR